MPGTDDPVEETSKLFAKRKVLREGTEGAFWEMVTGAMHGQLVALRNSIGMVDSMDAAFRIAECQGRIASLQLVMVLPSLMLEDIQKDIDQMLAEQREEREDG